MSPLCETYLTADQLDRMEPFYPLHVRVCERCLLVQIPEFVPPEDIFTEYAYFSSFSDHWVAHAKAYVDQAVERLGLGADDLVVEIASNDGYLLQHVVARGVRALGVEPARNVAEAAVARGVPTRVAFFGLSEAERMVDEGIRGNLVIGNNVLAQVPDLNDFVAGLARLLAEGGTLTLEFPHVVRLIEGRQFDTIYHEHFSYFSLLTTCNILDAHGLRVFDVEELETHGGSLRIWARHANEVDEPGPRVTELLERERAGGYDRPDAYTAFGPVVEGVKHDLLEFLIASRRAGRQVAGYGAPGKGNTLLNFCGIRTDLIAYTVDRNPYKHGRFLPGTHIPIHPPERIAETRPDDILILPWNLRDEIAAQLAYTKEWGARLVVPIPTTEVIS
jgi:SAM-dependent methyltransferase